MGKYLDPLWGPEPLFPKQGPLGLGRGLEPYKCIEPHCLGHLNPRGRCKPLLVFCGAKGCRGHVSLVDKCPAPLIPFICSVPGCPGHSRLGEKCFRPKGYCGARGCPGHEPPFMNTKCFPFDP